MTLKQLSYLPGKDKIVNVATVPLRSPFRYAGGKTWLVPWLRPWIASLQESPAEFIEPFAGGGIVSLTVAFENLADHITMVELDEGVAAVWRTILEGDADWLADKIVEFEITRESVETELAQDDGGLQERAFRTILRNRVNRGGILAPGAGMLKYGENGQGIRSRWYPETLARRIRAIAGHKDRITFIQGDGFKVLRDNAHRADSVFFIDPPYTAGSKKAGWRLYTHSDVDHEELFKIADTLVGDFLMTYSNDERVRKLAQRHGFDVQSVAMKSTHHAKMTELLVGRDLDWAR
jgi:DNA adenine methylase